jgi:hypothetical protein
MNKKISGRQKSEARRRITIVNPSICYYCKASDLESSEKHCPHCGLPQFGSQTEMKRFIWNINNKQQLLSDYIKAIDKAQLTIGSISFFSLLISIYFVVFHEYLIALALLTSSVTYFFIWHWSKQKPYPAMLLSFIIYIIVLVVTGIMEPNYISQGFYMKAIIAIALFYGYNSAKKGLVLLSELEYIAKAKGLNFVLEDQIEEISEDSSDR